MVFWWFGGKGSVTRLISQLMMEVFVEQPRLHRVCLLIIIAYTSLRCNTTLQWYCMWPKPSTRSQLFVCFSISYFLLKTFCPFVFRPPVPLSFRSFGLVYSPSSLYQSCRPENSTEFLCYFPTWSKTPRKASKCYRNIEKSSRNCTEFLHICQKHPENLLIFLKLDGVGPVDNRPFTD